MIDYDVQRASKLSIGPANTWSKMRINCKGKRVKMEMLADVKQTLLEDKKRSGGP
jgi:hypothetical protein